MQNRAVSFFDECLTLGQNLSKEERLALYRFLMTSKKGEFSSQAKILVTEKRFCSFVANGEIEYTITSNRVSYRSRKLDSLEFTSSVRSMNLGILHSTKVRRLRGFFAQSEVDIIRNFPLSGPSTQNDCGFGVNAIPYYSLKHYSNGRSRVLGLVGKWKSYNSDVLVKLRTL